jgi:acetylornithine deacetylase/succinyl-diaminopimelate desuccinylase-like protein
MADDMAGFLGSAPHAVSEADREAVKACIDKDEITNLALTLGNIPSQSRYEAEAAQYVYDWMDREGFRPRKVGATPERPNILGEYGGQGRGKSLLFTAHLDTESPTFDPDLDIHKYRPETLANPEWRKCWLAEDGSFRGYPITNDRGPMSAFLIAAKALKKAGIPLAGKLHLTASPGEIGPEPIEEFRGVGFMGKDIGTHYVFHHGGVAPDFAIAAEGTDFGLTWLGCGYVVFRIRLLGQSLFTPLIKHPEKAADHPNPIYRLGGLIEALHQWGRNFEDRWTYSSAGGTSIPKVQIDSVRSGIPYSFGGGVEVAHVYVEAGLTAKMRATDVQHEIEDALWAAGIKDWEIEPVIVRHGFEADAEAVAPLVGAMDAATRLTFGKPIEVAPPIYSSMWRDHNVFNMNRVPAVTAGFKRWRPTPQDLVDSALIYALTAIAVCGKAAVSGDGSTYTPVYGENPFGD